MNVRKTPLRLLILLPFLCKAAIGQETETGVVEEQRRYSVEIIIFEYTQNVSVGTEVFVPDAPLPEDEIEIGDDSIIASEPTAVVSKPEPERPIEFALMTEGDFTLVDAYQRMRRLEVYEPLAHFGWTQSTVTEEDAITRPLADFVRPPRGLDGEITLYLNRYLHLALDLKLEAPSKQNENVYAFESTPATHYRINENRIMRNGELRYFDHPRFGVLAKISRVEEKDDEPGEPFEEEFLGETELLGDISQ